MMTLKGKAGKVMQFLAMCGCMNIPTMRWMFDDLVSRTNYIYKMNKQEVVSRTVGVRPATYYLTDYGRKCLLSDYDTTPNVALYLIGNTQENCIEVKDAAVKERGRKLGELLVKFYRMGYSPLFTEKPDYFEIENEIIRRSRILLEEMDMNPNWKLRRINLEKNVEAAGNEIELLSRRMYDHIETRKRADVRKGGIHPELREKNRTKCFFTAREIKTGTNDIAALKMSRMMGLLITKQKSYMVYYPGKGSIRWNKQQELNMMMHIQRVLGKNGIYGNRVTMLGKEYINNLFIVDDYNVVLHILLMRFENNLRGDSFDDLKTYFATTDDIPLLINEELRKNFSAKLINRYSLQTRNKKPYYRGERCYIGTIFQLQIARAMDDDRIVFCLESQQELYKYYHMKPIVVDDIYNETMEEYREQLKTERKMKGRKD